MNTPSEPGSLTANELSYAYASRTAVESVSLRVHPGEMIALAGPNGSGKTTLLRLLAGVLAPVSGRVAVGHQALDELSPRARAQLISLVQQEADTRLAFTVRDVVSMGRAPYTGLLGTLGIEDRQAIDAAMSECQVDTLATRRLDELSGGEQQRVMLAMGLAQGAPYLLLDEPVVHLDLGHQHAILELLVGLRASRNLAVVAVLHDINIALLYFERLALMRSGRLIVDAPSAMVEKDHPALDVLGAPLERIRHPQTGVRQVLLRRGG